MTKVDWIVLWISGSITGWCSLMRFYSQPHWGRPYPYTWRVYKQTDGFDLSWCECFWLAVGCAVPPVALVANAFWLWSLYQVYRNHHNGQHPIHIPRLRLRLPKWPFPKCPTLIKGKKVE